MIGFRVGVSCGLGFQLGLGLRVPPEEALGELEAEDDRV